MTCPMMDLGGAERFVVQVVAGLAERGHQVGLVAAPGRLDPDLVGVPHHRFPLPPPTRSAVGAARLLVGVRRAVAAFGPDVVHAQNVMHAALAGAATRLVPGPRPPVVATFHGVQPDEYRAAARLFRAADAVACVSNDLLDGLVVAGHPASRAHLVRNAIDPPAPRTRERSDALDGELQLDTTGGRNRPVVAIVGRLVPQKAHHRFLRAAALVAEELPECRFLVVGDGELLPDVQELAHELGIADRVVFTGFRTDARDIIARADVLVFSSDWEGLSIAALEAMACGTPVVSTESHGMRTLLSSGAGEIVPGHAEPLGRAVVALLRDPARRAAMGAVGRQLAAEQFSLPAMLDNYVRLYEELAGRRASRRSGTRIAPSVPAAARGTGRGRKRDSGGGHTG